MLKCLNENYEYMDYEKETEENILNNNFTVKPDNESRNNNFIKSHSLLSISDIDFELSEGRSSKLRFQDKISSKVIVYLEKAVNTVDKISDDKCIQTDHAEKQSDYTYKILYLKRCTENFSKLSNDVEERVSMIESKVTQIKLLLKNYMGNFNQIMRNKHKTYADADTNTYDNWLNDFCEYNRLKEELRQTQLHNEHLITNHQKLENQVTLLQSNIVELSNENDRLKDEISDLIYDIDNLKSDNEFLKLENDSIKEQCLQIKILENELEEMKQKFAIELLQANQQCKHYQREHFDEKSKRIVSDRMLTLYKTKSEKLNQELIEMSNKLGPLECIALKNENCDLKFKLDESELQIITYKDVEKRYDDLVEQLKSKNDMIELTLTDLQNKYCIISSKSDKYRKCFTDIISEPFDSEILLQKVKTVMETT